MTACRSPLCAVFACVFLASVASSGPAFAREAVGLQAAVQGDELDPPPERRLLALDPRSISEQDVREVLAQVPAPRIIALHGSVPIHTMAPFADFLVARGYPAERSRNLRDGRLIYSSFVDSRELAGAIAWHYEREGMMPLLIGHSQGGMVAVKVLRNLAGASGEQLPVWTPVRGRAENRSLIVDPRSGMERPVVGPQVPYAAALATGSPMRVLLGQPDRVARLRNVPDSADEFASYFIAWYPITATWPDAASDDPRRAAGRARVREVMLPADYGHLTMPLAWHLADDPLTRSWISGFDPRVRAAPPPVILGADLRSVLHGADIWFSVKRHCCQETQRFVGVNRASHRLRS